MKLCFKLVNVDIKPNPVHVACSIIIFFMQVNNATPRPKRGPMSAQSNRGSFHGTACCFKDVPQLHVEDHSCMLHALCNTMKYSSCMDVVGTNSRIGEV